MSQDSERDIQAGDIYLNGDVMPYVIVKHAEDSNLWYAMWLCYGGDSLTVMHTGTTPQEALLDINDRYFASLTSTLMREVEHDILDKFSS